MQRTRGLFKVTIVVGVLLWLVCTQSADANGHQKKKKVVIHVPVHKKIEEHTHTIIKHIHHHHKPIVIKEEKVIHEEHHPIIHKEHISHEHQHHHTEKHEHVHPIIEEEEEHIHHHHQYEHKEESHES
ncbi:sex-determining region Y protein [Bactrocera dorsalis]|uniref:Sex-determining region Y protein n=1 Tax=Bactrocera dorsalis TaxID=27457 RepID=A0A9B2LF27_BACDO|nr:sex-determining region Y protein [Bactrocera dorsalis]